MGHHYNAECLAECLSIQAMDQKVFAFVFKKEFYFKKGAPNSPREFCGVGEVAYFTRCFITTAIFGCTQL